MKKILNLCIIAITTSILLSCAGNPVEESSSNDFSHLLNVNLISVEYYLIDLDEGSGLTGLWETKAYGKNTRSNIQFESDGNFKETVYTKLTKVEIVSYNGKYQVVGDELSMTTADGSTFHFLFSIKQDLLRLEQIESSQKSITK